MKLQQIVQIFVGQRVHELAANQPVAGRLLRGMDRVGRQFVFLVGIGAFQDNGQKQAVLQGLGEQEADAAC